MTATHVGAYLILWADDPTNNLNTYGTQAAGLATTYNALATPEILPDFAQHILALPDKASKRVLDIGCGSGRDAFWAAQQGVAVDAFDGAEGMLKEARTEHSHPLIHYMHDTAPQMNAVQALGRKYDVVLMSAFLFHFDQAERREFYKNLIPLLNPECSLYVTLRHGPVPAGRIMHTVPLQELEDFAQKNGGSSFYHGQKSDPLKREGVRWDHVSLRLGSP